MWLEKAGREGSRKVIITLLSTSLVKTDTLNKTELEAFNEWEASEELPLSPIAGARLYERFLHGSSCADIAALNPGISLGQIVQARLVQEWDRRRNEYVDDLLKTTESKHKQVALETINFVSDLLSANNTRFNNKLQKFLKTGQEKDLEDLAMNLKQFKEMADLHHKLLATQTEKRTVVTGEVLHTHRQELQEPEDPSVLIEKLLEKDN